MCRRGRERRCWNLDCGRGKSSWRRCDSDWQPRVWNPETVRTLSPTSAVVYGRQMSRFCVFLLTYSVSRYRIITGSNSDYVLHNASCPVAIVRHIEEDLKVHDPLNSVGGSRKVVLAVDESREVFLLSILPQ